MSIVQTETNVQHSDVDFDALFGQPGADSVMLPGETKEKKNTVFSPIAPDVTFLDKPIVPEPAAGTKPADVENQDNPPVNAPTTKEDITSILDIPVVESEEEKEKNKGGRPNAMISVAKNLIDKGILFPFDGEKTVDSYTTVEIEELIELNIKEKEKELEEKYSSELPEKFFGNLPLEMQQAYKYIADGGTNIKEMFATLASSLEAQDIDISKAGGQKQAIRSYLQAISFGTAEEVEDEILNLEDRGELEKKAKQFKPKLDSMQQSIVEEKLIEQERTKQMRQKQSQMYTESVYNTLEKGELNGIKLDGKSQSMLYAGLTQSNYPSVSGRQTNLLGHLLEKYQWVEPNHALIAEALLLLADPDGYRKNIANAVTKEVTAKTMKTLKTEQATKSTTSTSVASDTDSGTIQKRTITRPKENTFFKRF